MPYVFFSHLNVVRTKIGSPDIYSLMIQLLETNMIIICDPNFDSIIIMA